MYHCKDGLFFERLPHGDLRMVKTTDGKHPDGANMAFEVTVSRSVVASLMATACARGYTTETFYDAYAFLQAGDEPRVN